MCTMYLPGLTKFCQNLIFFLPFTTFPSTTTTNAESFTYQNPTSWPKHYPQCGGKKQSPIEIVTDEATPVEIPPIKFRGYDTLLSDYLTIENNGHTIKFDVPPTIENMLPFITHGPLKGKYEATEVHFHWGSPSTKGSEHQINKRRCDLEMHIVHRNVKYAAVAEARKHKDGLAVIAVLLKKAKRGTLSGLDTIFNIVPFVMDFNTTASEQILITLDSLLPNINRENYYTYEGSLTTPPCSESITWLVYPEIIPIWIQHMRNFWSIRDDNGNLLYNNFRPLQPTGERKVYFSKEIKVYDYA